MSRWPRRSLTLLGGSGALLALHELLVAAMAEGRIADALLSAGNGPPPLGAAALAALLLVVRMVAVLLVPGALLAGLVGIAAHVLVGPSRSRPLG